MAVFNRSSLRVLVPVVASLFVVAGCGASSPTHAAKSAHTSKQPAKAVTVAQLKTILPAPADVGDGYKVTSSNDSSNSSDPALIAAAKQQCPKSSGYFADTSSDPHVATRSYVTPDGRGIDVELSPDAAHSADFGTAEQLDEAITAIEKCPALSFDESDGSHVDLKMKATKSNDHGDLGMLLDLDVSLSGAGLHAPIHTTDEMRAFEVGNVGVQVRASGSIVADTRTAIPADTGAVDSLSASLAKQVAALQH